MFFFFLSWRFFWVSCDTGRFSFLSFRLFRFLKKYVLNQISRGKVSLSKDIFSDSLVINYQGPDAALDPADLLRQLRDVHGAADGGDPRHPSISIRTNQKFSTKKNQKIAITQKMAHLLRPKKIKKLPIQKMAHLLRQFGTYSNMPKKKKIHQCLITCPF